MGSNPTLSAIFIEGGAAMAMWEKVKAKNPAEYIESVKDETRRAEITKVHKLIRKTVPKLKPHVTYGAIGYGSFHYKSASGKEGDWPVIVLASQKHHISVYICASQGGKYVAEKHASGLGNVSVGKSCIRFKKMDDLNVKTFEKAMREGAKMMASKKK
ncbi:MAG: DUF1801 domain-containing protein [Acidobacteria bacterium]|nr:DUF1801 domain-containing protein [Acidobacteriota bacterium]